MCLKGNGLHRMKCALSTKVKSCKALLSPLLLPFLTFFQAVEKTINKSGINDKAGAYKSYLDAVSGKSNSIARTVATDILGEPVFWDWDGQRFISCHMEFRLIFIYLLRF